MELVLFLTSPASPKSARPQYLLKVGRRLVPVTRESLVRLGMLREGTPPQPLHLEE